MWKCGTDDITSYGGTLYSPSLVPRPRPAFRCFQYCKRRKAEQGLGMRVLITRTLFHGRRLLKWLWLSHCNVSFAIVFMFLLPFAGDFWAWQKEDWDWVSCKIYEGQTYWRGTCNSPIPPVHLSVSCSMLWTTRDDSLMPSPSPHVRERGSGVPNDFSWQGSSPIWELESDSRTHNYMCIS